MQRQKMDVLPTWQSPTRMILYLWQGFADFSEIIQTVIRVCQITILNSIIKCHHQQNICHKMISSYCWLQCYFQPYHSFILYNSPFLYSTMSQPQLHSSLKDVIIIRHAQSNFNKGYLNFKQLNGPHLSWYQCIEIEEFNKKVSYAKDFIDCAITSQGVEQCKAAKQTLKDEEIDVVLVSPHLRALQTCRQIFGQRKVRVEVHPILAEVFRYSCDISNHIDEKVKEFPDYDFSFMKDHSELWFVDILSENLKNTCNSHIQASGELTFREKQEKLLELMQSKVVYESPEELRARTWKIKELLAQYKKKYNKIVIVSHFQLLQALSAKQYDEIGEVNNFQMLENARPYFLSLDELLSIR